MRRITAFTLLFLSFYVSAQKQNEECLRVIYDADSSLCGYINSEGDTTLKIIYRFCFNDSISTFGSVISEDGKALAFDNKGNFMYEVFYVDNGPDYISEGLFRIVEGGKIGFATESGAVVIKPQYDCAFAFEDGMAQVSFDCQRIMVDEYEMWESESWFYIDKEGVKIKRE
ncbi:WG repeat-containing protein [Crocinitomix catalasitica]|nr:WG repeat-containing protein [Crocinitomix catalasitica]